MEFSAYEGEFLLAVLAAGAVPYGPDAVRSDGRSQVARICEFSDLGRSAKSLANLYSHLMNKLARFHSHSTFLRDCRDHNLIPHGLSLNIKPRSEREAKWKKNAEEARLRLAFNEARAEIFRTRARLQGIKTSLVRRGASEAAMTRLQNKGEDIYLGVPKSNASFCLKGLTQLSIRFELR